MGGVGEGVEECEDEGAGEEEVVGFRGWGEEEEEGKGSKSGTEEEEEEGGEGGRGDGTRCCR